MSAVGAPVAVEEIPRPIPREGEVLLRVTACGVCHSDLHVAKGDIPFPTPCVLGHEISGTVEEPGSSGLKAGQRAVASFIMPCGKCDPCRAGRDDLCETYFAMNRAKGTLYDGKTRLFRADGTPLAMNMMGGLAEFAVVPQTDVFALPDSLPLAESCILGCAIMTSYGALKHAAGLRPGQSVAVIGVGGVGSNVVALARLFGAGPIVAVDVRSEKLEAARRWGATHAVGSAGAVEAVLEATGGRGVDVAVEALGRPETVEQAFRMAAGGGAVVLVGVAPGKTAVPLEINRFVRRGIRMVGSFGCRVRSDMPEIIRLAAEGKIDVTASVTRRYPLERVQGAYDEMEHGRIVGRAIIIMG